MVMYAPLDIEFWLVNVFSGNSIIFSIVALITLLVASLKFKIPSYGILVLTVLLSAILFTLGETWLFLLIIFGLGLILAYIIGRLNN